MSGKANSVAEKKPLKVLAVGDVRGRVSDLVKRLRTIHKKAGPFDMVSQHFAPKPAMHRIPSIQYKGILYKGFF